MQIIAIEGVAALTSDEQQLIRQGWDGLPNGTFGGASLALYILADEDGQRRRVLAPANPTLVVGDHVSARISEVSFSQMSASEHLRESDALPLLEISKSLRLVDR